MSDGISKYVLLALVMVALAVGALALVPEARAYVINTFGATNQTSGTGGTMSGMANPRQGNSLPGQLTGSQDSHSGSGGCGEDPWAGD